MVEVMFHRHKLSGGLPTVGQFRPGPDFQDLPHHASWSVRVESLNSISQNWYPGIVFFAFVFTLYSTLATM